jgi:hypothetical protein
LIGKPEDLKRQSPDMDVQKWEDRHPTVIQESVGPMEIMMEAVKSGSGKEVLEQLQGMFEFQQKIDADNARKAHFEAKAAFKLEAPPLKKDKWNDWLKCWYTSLGQLLDTYNPVLGKHGLSVSFAPPQQDDNSMTVECRLAHSLGHVESVSMSGPIDKAAIGKQSGKASRNPMQDLRSTFTYLRSTTLEAVLGVSGTEATKDDDGNASGSKKEPKFITEKQVKEITKRLKEIYGDDPSMFFTWIEAETVDTITDYAKAKKGLDGAEKAKAKKDAADKDESRLGE